MLHLFNSCYVCPDVLFDANGNYLIVGKNSNIYGVNVENSFYYNNVIVGQCLGRFTDVIKLITSDIFRAAVNSKERFVIYADQESMVQIHHAFIKTQVKGYTEKFYVDIANLLGIRLEVIANQTTIQSTKDILLDFAKTFKDIKKLPVDIGALPLKEDWVKHNSGIEWQIANGNHSNVTNMINRFIFSFVEEARACFLSRKEPSGWVLDESNFNFNTVESMSDLYNNIRKEICVVADKMILDYFNGTVTLDAVIHKPEFLLMIASNKDLHTKIDIWLLRYLLEQPTKQLGIVA